VGHPNYLHFGLCRRSANVPLGWVLSRATRQRMDEQLANGAPCGVDGTEAVFNNPAKLAQIDALFAAPYLNNKGTEVIPVTAPAPGKSSR